MFFGLDLLGTFFFDPTCFLFRIRTILDTSYLVFDLFFEENLLFSVLFHVGMALPVGLDEGVELHVLLAEAVVLDGKGFLGVPTTLKLGPRLHHALLQRRQLGADLFAHVPVAAH